MGLRIQTNVAAMNAHRNLNIADRGLSKSLERLSSGYRINSAADDASGLAVATKFRANVASLSAASRNVTEATSLLQVAQGGTDTISGIITRMKELATMAASGTAERDRIDEEQTALESEITRIVNSTKYNGANLLDGNFGTISVSDYGTLTAQNGITAVDMSAAAGGATFTIDHQSTNNTMTITRNGTAQTLTATAQTNLDTAVLNFSSHGIKVSYNDDYFDISGAGLAVDTIATTHTATATFQVGYENDSTGSQIGVDLNSLTLASLGLDLDMTSISAAQSALDSIDAAITTLSTAQGKIGAYANRLSYASANIISQMENLSASESVIRDVDMAAEMSSFTKNQILLQAGTAMLAQANMAPQQVLSLLG